MRRKLPDPEIGEPPDRSAVWQFENRAARQRLTIGVESDRVIAAVRKPGVPFDHDAFGDAARQCGRWQDGPKRNTKAAIGTRFPSGIAVLRS